MTHAKLPIDVAMQDIQPQWRHRWCGGGICACMGAANCSGGLSGKGYTREEWEKWVALNPDPNPPKPFDREAFIKVLKMVCDEQAGNSIEDIPETLQAAQ